MSAADRERGRRGVLAARLALAEAEGGAHSSRARFLQAALAEFDEAAKYRVVNGGRLPYRDTDGAAAS